MEDFTQRGITNAQIRNLASVHLQKGNPYADYNFLNVALGRNWEYKGLGRTRLIDNVWTDL